MYLVVTWQFFCAQKYKCIFNKQIVFLNEAVSLRVTMSSRTADLPDFMYVRAWFWACEWDNVWDSSSMCLLCLIKWEACCGCFLRQDGGLWHPVRVLNSVSVGVSIPLIFRPVCLSQLSTAQIWRPSPEDFHSYMYSASQRFVDFIV